MCAWKYHNNASNSFSGLKNDRGKHQPIGNSQRSAGEMAQANCSTAADSLRWLQRHRACRNLHDWVDWALPVQHIWRHLRQQLFKLHHRSKDRARSLCSSPWSSPQATQPKRSRQDLWKRANAWAKSPTKPKKRNPNYAIHLPSSSCFDERGLWIKKASLSRARVCQWWQPVTTFARYEAENERCHIFVWRCRYKINRFRTKHPEK